MTLPRRIGILAGGGPFPHLVAQNNPDAYIIRLEPFWDDLSLLGMPGMNTRMDKVGRIFAALRQNGISDIVLVGRVRRPKILALRPDRDTLRLLPEIILSLWRGGDDALLRAVRASLEKRGFTLHGVQDLVAGLMAPQGVMGVHAPDQVAHRDIERGLEAARDHGAADKGQAIVVQHGRILDVEGRDGTDALIARIGQLRVPGPGPVLVKTAKPGQDRALDMPTIGPDTVENCAKAGFAGIAVEAGATLVADKARTIGLADAHGLFMIGVA